MVHQIELLLPPYRRGFHLITDLVVQHLHPLPGKGVLHLFMKHTSAGLTLNENCSSDVLVDFETSFNRLVPEDRAYYTHTDEGSDDMPAHIKTTLTGNSVSIPITNHQLNLGIWQGFYFCEFRNRATSRRLVATILS